MRRKSSCLRIAAMAAAMVCMGTAAHAVTIFTDSFTSSALGSAWTKSGTGNWRVQTSTGYRVGTSGYGVTFDDSVSGGYSYSRLDLKQNLAGYSSLSLTFQMRNVGDEAHSQDGVYISADGTTFYKCSWSFPAKSSSFSLQTVNISATATANNIVLGPDAVIRFQQYDDTKLSSDGIAIDNVTLTGVIATPVASVKPGMGSIPYTSGGISGTTFRVWAPNASAVKVVGDFNGWVTDRHPLASEGSSGNWSVDVPGALINDQYKYYITYSGTNYWRQDPRAQDMTNDSGNSIIADLSYSWANSFSMPAWNEMIIYETHIGTFYRSSSGTPGTFNDASTKLQYLKDRGINAIKIMPIMEFPGMTSWGYNPHSQFAPESDYGTPKQLKQLIDAAHGKGIAVILDVVYNHMGSSPNESAIPLWNFDGPSLGNGGIYFFTDWRKQTPWGWSRPDYGRGEVRTFLRDSALYWLNEYHADGLRWDSTVNIRTQNNGGGGDIPDGWSLMQWINNEIDSAASWKISIAEDLQNNDYITKTTGAGGAGFDSQWDARFVHPIRTAVIEGNDSNRNMNAVRDAIVANYNGSQTQRVIYTESHDEVNNGHSRVPEEIWPGNASSWASKKRSTLGAGLVFTSPGIPMIFQGQEMLEDGYWSDTDPIDWSKTTTNSGIVSMYTDMMKLRRNWYNNTRGLRGNNVNVFHVNNTDKLIAFHRWDVGGAGDDVIVVANFKNTSYSAYNIGFPRGGTWYVRFNSDWNGYDSGFANTNSYNTTANSGAKDGLSYNGNIGIGPYTMIILSQ